MHTHVPLIYSGRVRRALQMAERAHRGVNRKTGDSPYFLHVVAVAALLSAAGADDDLVCGGFLHDCVEDTSMTAVQVEDEFGSRVAALVVGVTKTSTTDDGRALTKDEVVRATEQRMSQAGADVAALKAADLTANVSDLILDQQQLGYAHWNEVFKTADHAHRKVTHYLTLADILLGRLAYFDEYPQLASHLRTRAGQLRELYAGWEQAATDAPERSTR